MTEIISNKGTNGEPLTDTNGNPIQGAEIIAVSHGGLFADSNKVLAVTTTDANGEYAFTDAELPATYDIDETPKTDYVDIYARIGSSSDIRRATPIRPWQGYQLGIDIPTSVVARYEFEDDSDTSTALDSENGYDGSIVGATYTTTAAVGSSALSFDGDDQVDLPANITDTDASFSVAAWIKTTQTSGIRAVVTNRDGANKVTQGFIAEYDGSTGLPQLRMHDDVDDILTGNTAINDGNYHHVVWVYDSSTGDRYIYVDNTQDASDNVSLGDTSSSEKWRIGSQNGASYVVGEIDDVYVANAPFDANDVDSLYQLG
jgi:hypothetical protein